MFLDLVGQKFNNLTVIREATEKKTHRKERVWECECECKRGIKRYATTGELKSGRAKSCGCIAGKKYNTYDLSGSYGIGYTSKGIAFYFDLEDYEKIKEYCWTINDAGYVVARSLGGNKIIRLHRLIMDFPDGFQVDHEKGNKKDNRKSKLRICNHIQNSQNRKYQSGSSGFIGIKPVNENGKFQSRITVNKKQIHLGTFDCITDALVVRLSAEKKYFGEFAPQQHLFAQYGIG